MPTLLEASMSEEPLLPQGTTCFRGWALLYGNWDKYWARLPLVVSVQTVGVLNVLNLYVQQFLFILLVSSIHCFFFVIWAKLFSDSKSPFPLVPTKKGWELEECTISLVERDLLCMLVHSSLFCTWACNLRASNAFTRHTMLKWLLDGYHVERLGQAHDRNPKLHHGSCP